METGMKKPTWTPETFNVLPGDVVRMANGIDYVFTGEVAAGEPQGRSDWRSQPEMIALWDDLMRRAGG